MTYTYKAVGDDSSGYTLFASPSGFLALPEILHPPEGILHPTKASAFASAAQHHMTNRTNAKMLLPADLTVVADTGDDEDDDED